MEDDFDSLLVPRTALLQVTDESIGLLKEAVETHIMVKLDRTIPFDGSDVSRTHKAREQYRELLFWLDEARRELY